MFLPLVSRRVHNWGVSWRGISKGTLAPLKCVTPVAVGLSEERLHRFADYFHDQSALAGSVLSVARHGQVCHMSSAGRRALMGPNMTEDTIFRIYSMTKIVTSVAMMQLYERGLFQLDEPVDAFLPCFKATMVNKSRDGEICTEPMKQPITIRHLLTHTSGLTYSVFDPSPVGNAYTEAGISEDPNNGMPLDKFVDTLARMPLKFQPGEGFQYGFSTDVLGRLVEVLSGQPFDVYLQEHIFNPLHMVDTGFSIKEEAVARLATIYEMGPDGLQECKVFNPCGKPVGLETRCAVGIQPPFLSGGAGLFSTAADFMRFSLMLAGKGILENTRILGRKTVELMRRNHLPEGRDLASMGGDFPDFYHHRGMGFGLGVAVVLNQDAGFHCSNGSYFWQGVGSTYHFHDPVEDLTIVAMGQFLPVFAPEIFKVRYGIATLGSQAIID